MDEKDGPDIDEQDELARKEELAKEEWQKISVRWMGIGIEFLIVVGIFSWLGYFLDEKGGKFCDQILKSSEEIAALVETINLYISTKETPIAFVGINVKEILQLIREEF